MKSRPGFTLIEVLIALVVLSVGIVGVLQAFETSVVALGATRDRMWADMLIKDKMADLKSQGNGHDPAVWVSSDGDFDGRYADFRWDLEVKKVTVPQGEEPLTNFLNEVTMTVWRQGTGKEYSTSTYVITDK